LDGINLLETELGEISLPLPDVFYRIIASWHVL
jgi:hypothetical protein